MVRGLGDLGRGGEEQEAEGDQEEQVDGAHLARLPHARVRGPDVEQGGGGGPDADRPADPALELPHGRLLARYFSSPASR